MGSLAEMIEFLDATERDLQFFYGKLEEIQLHFDGNVRNVIMIREDEVGFLQDAFLAEPAQFPEAFRQEFESQLQVQAALFDTQLDGLRARRDEKARQLSELETRRDKHARTVRERHTALDRQEEDLKRRVAELEAKIADYNARIQEMSSGLGFMLNLFRMKQIEKQKVELLGERDRIVPEIEALRTQWQERAQEYAGEEAELLDQWNTLRVETSLVAEKYAHLLRDRAVLIRKSAFLAAAGMLSGDSCHLLADQPAVSGNCRRCKIRNKTQLFFCAYCGERFAENRPDVAGSLVELGELNQVQAALEEGIRESAAFLGLLKGLRDGVTAFGKSVASVKQSQDTYSALSKLKIEVPPACREYARQIAELGPRVDVEYMYLHPREFAAIYRKMSEGLFTPERIEGFFKTMGDELNRTTKEQWG